MVIIESSVDTATVSADSSLFPPNFIVNIVELAATGADADTAQATSSVPLTPNSYVMPRTMAGQTKRLKTIIIYSSLSLMAFLRSILDTLYPMTSIGTGVLSAAR